MANGNFVPFAGRTLPDPTLPGRVAPAQEIQGQGPPEGVATGNAGQRYTDIDTGLIYTKVTGTATLGWILTGFNSPVSGGGGGGGGVQSVFAWDGTGPMPTANGPAILLGKGGVAGQMWLKTTSGISNTDWVLL